MPISWYPGHMHKARRQLVASIRETDVVLELLDARAPLASSNPLLAEIRGSLPCIRVLNKTDLADPVTTRHWERYFARQTHTQCLVNGRDCHLSRQKLLSACGNFVVHSNDPARRYQLLITGIPNVGKSTLLNQLLARKVAKIGNEPAVTRAQQRVKLADDWFLVDTPGMMWPKLEDQEAAYRLAALGTIRNTAIDIADIGWHAAGILLVDFYSLLKDRYRLQAKPSGVEELLTRIGKSHGCLGPGGHVDWHRVSELLLGDLRSGRLGRLSLETPEPESDTEPQD